MSLAFQIQTVTEQLVELWLSIDSPLSIGDILELQGPSLVLGEITALSWRDKTSAANTPKQVLASIKLLHGKLTTHHQQYRHLNETQVAETLHHLMGHINAPLLMGSHLMGDLDRLGRLTVVQAKDQETLQTGLTQVLDQLQSHARVLIIDPVGLFQLAEDFRVYQAGMDCHLTLNQLTLNRFFSLVEDELPTIFRPQALHLLANAIPHSPTEPLVLRHLLNPKRYDDMPAKGPLLHVLYKIFRSRLIVDEPDAGLDIESLIQDQLNVVDLSSLPTTSRGLFYESVIQQLLHHRIYDLVPVLIYPEHYLEDPALCAQQLEESQYRVILSPQHPDAITTWETAGITNRIQFEHTHDNEALKISIQGEMTLGIQCKTILLGLGEDDLPKMGAETSETDWFAAEKDLLQDDSPEFESPSPIDLSINEPQKLANDLALLNPAEESHEHETHLQPLHPDEDDVFYLESPLTLAPDGYGQPSHPSGLEIIADNLVQSIPRQEEEPVEQWIPDYSEIDLEADTLLQPSDVSDEADKPDDWDFDFDTSLEPSPLPLSPIIPEKPLSDSVTAPALVPVSPPPDEIDDPFAFDFGLDLNGDPDFTSPNLSPEEPPFDHAEEMSSPGYTLDSSIASTPELSLDDTPTPLLEEPMPEGREPHAAQYTETTHPPRSASLSAQDDINSGLDDIYGEVSSMTIPLDSYDEAGMDFNTPLSNAHVRATHVNASAASVLGDGPSLMTNQSQVPVYQALDPEAEALKEQMGYNPGDTVVHEKYGTGIIERVMPMDGRITLKIQFESVGKRLLDGASKHLRPANV